MSTSRFCSCFVYTSREPLVSFVCDFEVYKHDARIEYNEPNYITAKEGNATNMRIIFTHISNSEVLVAR